MQPFARVVTFSQSNNFISDRFDDNIYEIQEMEEDIPV